MTIPKRPGVYAIINTVNGKCYIGSSTNLRRRYNDHFNALRQNKHQNIILQRAWEKHGQGNFVFRVLIICEKDERIFYEQKLLDTFCPEYNIAKDAQAPWKGEKLSEETRRKISIAGMGRKPTEETRKKLHEAQLGNKKGLGKTPWNKGKKTSPEIRAKISAAQTGMKRSDETRQKISNALKGKPKSEEHKRKLSEARLGKPNPSAVGKQYWLGRHHTEETKQLMSEKAKAYRKAQKELLAGGIE